MPLRIVVTPSGRLPPTPDEGLPQGDPTQHLSDIPTVDPSAPLAIEPAVAGDRDLEAALVRQVQQRRVAQAERWLDETAAPAEPPPTPAAAAAETPPASQDGIPVYAPPGSNKPKAGGAILRDVARGATEAPRQIVGGMRDAAQSAIDLVDWIGRVGAKGELRAAQLPEEQTNEALGELDTSTAPTLPEVKQPTTVTGGLVRGVSQFLTGFLAGGTVIKGAGLAAAAAKGAFSDFTAFEPHQERLANLIEQFPALQNPVTDYLAAKPDDGEAEGRLKNALQGLGLGVMTQGMFRALKYLRDAQRARAAERAASEAAAKAEAAPREAQPLTLLGDDNAPLLAKSPEAALSAVASRAAEVEALKDEATARLLEGTKRRLTAEKESAAQAAADRPRVGAERQFGSADFVYTPLSAGEKPLYINFARIEAAEDIQRVIRDAAQEFKGEIEAARRGVRSNEETIAAAGSKDAWDVLMARRRGVPLNAEEAVAGRALWVASAKKLMEVADVAHNAPTPENLFQFRRMLAVHQAVQAEVIAARTETARALQSWKIPVGSGADQLTSIENTLNTFGGAASELLARKIASLKNLPDGMQVLADVAERGAMAKSLDVVKEVWVNSLLGNPKTHVVNMLGNTIGLGVELIERLAAAGYSRAIGSGEIAPREAMAKFVGLSRGSREGVRLFWRALQTGESQFGADTTKIDQFKRAITAENFNINPNNWLGRAVDGLGSIVNIPVRFLNAEDDFFKAVGYRMELNARAFRQVDKEVADGAIPRERMNARFQELLDNPPEDMRLDAVGYARYQTFTDAPGKLVSALNAMDRRMAEGSPGEQIASLGLRILIPFRNTPANLTKYAFERTPLAPLMSRYREAIAQGGAQADIARTRLALGAFSMLALMDLALDGNVTGGGPRGQENKGVRDTLLRSGWKPYAIKVGDRYFDYRRTDPFGQMLGVAADIAEIVNNASLDEEKQEDISAMVAAATVAFANNVLDKTYMSSLSDFMDVMHNPDKAPSWAERRAGSFVPAAAGETRRQVDPYMRWTAGYVDEIRNRIPGLSETLPMQRDLWGRPKTFESGMGKLYDAISPIASRKFDPEPIDKVAIAQNWNIEMPQWSLATGGVRVSIKRAPEAYSRFLELRGQNKPSALATAPMQDEAGIAKAKIKDLSDAELLIKKYGDVPMLTLLNDMAEGKGSALRLPLGAPKRGEDEVKSLAQQWKEAGDGRGGGKDHLVHKIISDYGRAAKGRLISEYAAIGNKLERKATEKEGRKLAPVVAEQDAPPD